MFHLGSVIALKVALLRDVTVVLPDRSYFIGIRYFTFQERQISTKLEFLCKCIYLYITTYIYISLYKYIRIVHLARVPVIRLELIYLLGQYIAIFSYGSYGNSINEVSYVVQRMWKLVNFVGKYSYCKSAIVIWWCYILMRYHLWWWCHEIETLSKSVALCEGKTWVTCWYLTKSQYGKYIYIIFVSLKKLKNMNWIYFSTIYVTSLQCLRMHRPFLASLFDSFPMYDTLLAFYAGKLMWVTNGYSCLDNNAMIFFLYETGPI